MSEDQRGGGYQPYPGGGYQAFPGGESQLPEQQPGQPAPPSVINAVRTMYVGAAASLIGIIIGLTTVSSIRSRVHQLKPDFTTSQVNTSVHAAVAVLIIEGLIAIGLWIWMAQASKAGKNWARITSTVFFGLDTLGQIISLTQATGVADRIYAIIVWLIGLVAIVFLWQRQSSAYFGRPRS